MSKKAVRRVKRSGTHKCPICSVLTKLCKHHLNGRDIPRAEDDFNIAWICPTCHDLVHSGVIIIEGWFRTSNGMELIWRNREDDTITGMETTPPSY